MTRLLNDPKTTEQWLASRLGPSEASAEMVKAFHERFRQMERVDERNQLNMTPSPKKKGC